MYSRINSLKVETRIRIPLGLPAAGWRWHGLQRGKGRASVVRPLSSSGHRAQQEGVTLATTATEADDGMAPTPSPQLVQDSQSEASA